ncbi:hypothetical protein QNZ43_004702, partial [Enterobacter roggenkampii]|nr:hypothetical protein [Enterobacter roggenkampii]
RQKAASSLTLQQCLSWQGPPCAAPQGRHQRVRRRPRLARPQPSVEKVYARHPPSPVLRVSGRSAGRAQCQQTRDERWPSTVIRRHQRKITQGQCQRFVNTDVGVPQGSQQHPAMQIRNIMVQGADFRCQQIFWQFALDQSHLTQG